MTTLHTKACFANAWISAIENGRDRSDWDDADFERFVGGDESVQWVLGYLDHEQVGMDSICKCHVKATFHVQQRYRDAGAQAATDLAASYLQNGELSVSQYLDLVKWSEGRGSLVQS